MSRFEKTNEVDDDIARIVDYTVDRWGVDQVRKYIDGLEKRLNEFADGTIPSKRLDHVIPGLAVIRYEHHYVFGLERSNQPLLIIAIFHERMDLMQRLQDRLA